LRPAVASWPAYASRRRSGVTSKAFGQGPDGSLHWICSGLSGPYHVTLRDGTWHVSKYDDDITLLNSIATVDHSLQLQILSRKVSAAKTTLVLYTEPF